MMGCCVSDRKEEELTQLAKSIQNKEIVPTTEEETKELLVA